MKLVEGYPALLIEPWYLIIGDLHIGYEAEARKRGVFLNPLVDRFLSELKDLKDKTKAEELFILGDVKHSIVNPGIDEVIEISRFFDSCLQMFRTVHVVPGNHDGGIRHYLRPEIKFYSPHGTVIEEADGTKVGLVHGHALPGSEVFNADVIVVAHLHLSVKYSGLKLGVWAKLKHPEREFIFLPPFNRFLPGQSLTSFKPGLPFLSHEWIMEAEIYTLEGYKLGKVSELDRVLVEVEMD